MRRILFAALLALLPFTGLAETRDERIAVAAEYIDLSLQDMDMGAIIATMWTPVVNEVEKSGKVVTDLQRKKLQELYMATFEAPMVTLTRDQATIMADIMSMAELTALRDFYKTPEGRSVMKKLPLLVQAQQPGIMALVEGNLPTLIPQITAILEQ